MSEIIYTDELSTFKEDAFIAVLKKTEGKDNLLEELFKKLKFPSYFGFNWDALSDCLRDFDWIEKKEIVLVHKELPDLEDNVFKIYLEVLIDAVNDWKKDENHFLTVVFPKNSNNLIEGYINEMQ